ncbi:MAG: hypothetical protein DWQ09_02025 [Proteobacteria bacterium]|nr:MAG: hypothetical protein DWQ09_02025 [Pseudomonadota bacterium]
MAAERFHRLMILSAASDLANVLARRDESVGAPLKRLPGLDACRLAYQPIGATLGVPAPQPMVFNET